MGYIVGRDPVEGYVWLREPSTNLGSSAPWRVDTETPDPEYKPNPVGFATRPAEVEPLLWEGDGA